MPNITDKFPRVVNPPDESAHVRPRRSAFPLRERFPSHTENRDPQDPHKIAPRPGYETTPTIAPETPPDKLLGMKVIAIDLSATFTDRIYDIPGNFILIADSDNATDRIFVKPNDMSDYIPMRRGFCLAGVGFNKVLISNRVAVASAIMYLAYTYDPGPQQVRIQ